MRDSKRIPHSADHILSGSLFRAGVLIFLLSICLFGAESDTTDIGTTDTQKTASQGITDTVFYESEFIDYDSEGKVLQLVGRAQVKYQNVLLQADTIIYTVDDNEFKATGLPQLVEGNDTTIGDYMVYNIKTRRGKVRYATTSFDDSYFTGSNIVKTEENHLYVDQGDYTSCAHVETPHYYFYGRKIKVIPEDKIISKPVVLNIGDAPVALLPYFMFPLQKKRQSGWLTPVWGGHPTRGGFLDNVGYYFAPNDYVDLVLRAKVQEFNHFIFNAASSYALRYKLNGKISARYVLDNGLENSSRSWALDYSHNQYLTPDQNTRLSGNGNIVSQSTFYRQFSDETDELEEQNLTANLSLSHKFKNINASANLVYRRNHNLVTDHIQQDVPSIDFNLHNRAIVPFDKSDLDKDEPSWYNNIYYNYSTKANVREDRYGNDSIKGFIRPGMTHAFNLTSSQKLFDHIDINPYFSTRASMFYGAIDTLIKDTLMVHDTVEYVVDNPMKDTKYSSYTGIDTVAEYFINEEGELDTLYTMLKESPGRKEYVRDTFPDEFNLVNSWRTGVNMSTRIYGIFPLKFFNYTGLRHTLTPTVGYSYIPKHDLDRRFYDVKIPYDAARPKSQQLVNLSLGNNFQGKRLVGEGENQREEKFDILTANLSTAYDFEAEERKWRDLSLSAYGSYSFLRVNYSSSFWLYDENDRLSTPILKNYNIQVNPGNLGVRGSFWDGDLLVLDSLQPHDPIKYRNAGPQSWNVSISPSFSYRASRPAPGEPFVPTKSYNLSASAKLNFTRNWALSWNGNYDFTSDQFTHNSFLLTADLECWEMRFSWRPEKLNPGYHFVINIKKIPDIKWEQRD